MSQLGRPNAGLKGGTVEDRLAQVTDILADAVSLLNEAINDIKQDRSNDHHGGSSPGAHRFGSDETG